MSKPILVSGLVLVAITAAVVFYLQFDHAQTPSDHSLSQTSSSPTLDAEGSSSASSPAKQHTQESDARCTPPPAGAVTYMGKALEAVGLSDLRFKKIGVALGDDLRGLFDESCWTITNQISAVVSGIPVKIALLSSVYPTGEMGVGEAAYDVDLLVAADRRVLYHFATSTPVFGRQSDRSFMSEKIELADVTNDGIPEIIFHAGVNGVSDFYEQLYVLRFESTRQGFTEIGHGHFYLSGLDATFWLDVNSKSYAVLADGIWGQDEGHYGEHHYQFTVYTWNASNNAFEVVKSMKSAEKYDDAKRAFDGNLDPIKTDL